MAQRALPAIRQYARSAAQRSSPGRAIDLAHANPGSGPNAASDRGTDASANARTSPGPDRDARTHRDTCSDSHGSSPGSGRAGTGADVPARAHSWAGPRPNGPSHPRPNSASDAQGHAASNTESPAPQGRSPQAGPPNTPPQGHATPPTTPLTLAPSRHLAGQALG